MFVFFYEKTPDSFSFFSFSFVEAALCLCKRTLHRFLCVIHKPVCKYWRKFNIEDSLFWLGVCGAVNLCVLAWLIPHRIRRRIYSNFSPKKKKKLGDLMFDFNLATPNGVKTNTIVTCASIVMMNNKTFINNGWARSILALIASCCTSLLSQGNTLLENSGCRATKLERH